MILFSPWLANAEAARKFNPLVSSDARTVPQGKVTYSRSTVANVNSSFLANSLNLGVLPRVEIGTAPVFYLSRDHKFNFTTKLNFYRGSQFDWALSYSEVRFNVAIDNVGTELILSGMQLATNWHPTFTPVSVSAFYGSVCGNLNSGSYLVLAYSFRCRDEMGLDFQIPTAENQWLTLGIGRLRNLGYSPYEEITNGVGLSYSIFLPRKFFSRPSLGLYAAQKQKLLFLFSTTFTEE